MTMRICALALLLWAGNANADDAAIATLQAWLSKPEGTCQVA